MDQLAPLQNPCDASDTPMMVDYYLQALADGELPEQEQKKIRALMAERPAWRKRYHQIKTQNQLLKTWWTKENRDH